MKEQILSTILQCTLFIGIPWVAYIFFNREKTGFLRWIGLYKPQNSRWVKKAIFILIIAVVIMGGPIFIFEKLKIIPEGMVYSLDAGGKGFTAEIIVIVLIKAIFQTALSEEIFFRGRVLDKCAFVLEYAGLGNYHGVERPIRRYKYSR